VFEVSGVEDDNALHGGGEILAGCGKPTDAIQTLVDVLSPADWDCHNYGVGVVVEVEELRNA